MNNSYRQYHRQLLINLSAAAQSALADELQGPHASEHQPLIDQLQQLTDLPTDNDTFSALGQTVLNRIVAGYPQLLLVVPRDLFWFFGGDCLHYMPDEEITFFQQLDELRYEAEQQGETFDYRSEREKRQFQPNTPGQGGSIAH